LIASPRKQNSLRPSKDSQPAVPTALKKMRTSTNQEMAANTNDSPILKTDSHDLMEGSAFP